MPFWLPQGTVLLRLIEAEVRKQLDARGYEEIKTPQVLDVELWHRSGHWDNYKENMFFTAPSEREGAGEERAVRAQADELPGRLPGLRLEPPLLPRAAAAPRRVRPRLALRARGRAPRPAAGARLHPGRRARLLHARSGHRRGRLDLRRRSTSSTSASASTRSGSSSRPGRRSRSAPTSSGSGPRRALREALERQGRDYDVSPGRGHLLRAEDRLPRHRRARPLLAVRHLPARLPDAGALRAHLHGRRQRRAPAGDDPPRAAGLDGAVRGDPDRALRRPLPALARAGAGAGPAGRRPPQRARGRGRRASCGAAACGCESTSARSRSARRSATPSSPRRPTCSSWATRRPRPATVSVRHHGDGDLGAMDVGGLTARMAGRRRLAAIRRGALGVGAGVYTAPQCRAPTPRRAAKRPVPASPDPPSPISLTLYLMLS